jgi:DNA-binding CsgD family transcriptional regulator
MAEPLIGRVAELTALRAALSESLAGSGGDVCVLGEAGIGKSRLALELAAEAAVGGATVVPGRAVAGPGRVPFRPWSEALLTLARRTGIVDAEELRGFRPALATVVPEWESTQPSAPAEGTPLVIAEGILRLLARAGRPGGCVVVLEDLHWADAESLGVLEYLADHLADQPVLCLATVRDEEPSSALELVHRLAARRAVRAIALGRLSDQEIVALLRFRRSPGQSDSAVAQAVAYAEGVPFIAEELLAAVSAPGEPIPRTFAASVARRFAALAEDEQRVLLAAAVLGRRFDWRLLAPVSGQPAGVVRSALDEAAARSLLVVEYGGFRFRHALTREALLAAALPPLVAELAAAAFTAVTDRGDASIAGRLLAADLAESAGRPGDAARLLWSAGRSALADGALGTAEQLLRRARRLAADLALRCSVEESLCEVLGLAGKADAAVEIGAGLLANLDRIAAPGVRRAGVHRRLAGVAIAAERWPEAIGHLRTARTSAGDAADAGLTAALAALGAEVALGRGDLASAERRARAAAAAAAGAGLPDVECQALELIGRCARVGDLAAARAAFQAALRTARLHGLALRELRALHELGTVDLLDHAGVSVLREARQRARDGGALLTEAVLDLQLAAAHQLRMEPAEALAAARRTATTATRFGWPSLATAAAFFEAQAHALVADRPRMETAARQALALADGDANAVGHVWTARGLTSLLQEDRTRALAEFTTGMASLRQAPAVVPSHFRGLWALLCAVSGADGPAAVDEVRSSGAAVNRLNRALLLWAEAVEAGRAGDRRAAALTAAAAEQRAQPFPWWAHLAGRLAAESALDDGWGVPERWLREAADAFTASGHGRPASACRSLLRRAGLPVPRRPPASTPPALRSAGVTARETEVFGLVAEGLTNRDIATRLYLSPRTVEKHVEALLRKTGTSSRSQLAALAGNLRGSTDETAAGRPR